MLHIGGYVWPREFASVSKTTIGFLKCNNNNDFSSCYFSHGNSFLVRYYSTLFYQYVKILTRRPFFSIITTKLFNPKNLSPMEENNKQINLFLVYTPGDGDFLFLQQMDVLSNRLKTHLNVRFMKYPKFELDDSESEKNLSIRTYEAIRKNILEADLFVAVATHGSSGLGIEVAIANSCNKRTLVFFEANLKLGRSKVVVGNCSENENSQIREYFSGTDLFDFIIDQVDLMLK